MNKAPDVTEAADQIDAAGYLVNCAFLAASNLPPYERDAIQAVLNKVTDHLRAANAAIYPNMDTQVR